MPECAPQTNTASQRTKQSRRKHNIKTGRHTHKTGIKTHVYKYIYIYIIYIYISIYSHLEYCWTCLLWGPPAPETVKTVLGILNRDLAAGLGDLSVALVLPLLSLVLPALPFGLPLLGLVLPALPFGLPLLGLVLPALPFGLPP